MGNGGNGYFESLNGYLWDEGVPDGWFGVKPPIITLSSWRSWLSRQNPLKRKFVDLGKRDSYWLMTSDFRKSVEDRFVLMGWTLVFGKPPHLSGNGSNGGEGVGMGEITGGIGNPYGILFVAPSAPKEVVDAAYRALQKKHHSDHGGSADDSKAFSAAPPRRKARTRAGIPSTH